ncbi:putative FBD-associated F-box protein At5g56440 [Brassica rapa]|uniref:F-box domain-containing protein n=1 Tax=Brassica campestris TaxID=3711 RepID=M4F3H1_BRACM|nr:putative FBD-associated F-box protein At5g56440 [Brassica rapa]
MDRMSLLPDDLIFKILSFVPSKVSVSTSLLSKRWCSLWKHVPNLRYFDPHINSEYWRASRFIDKFLLLRDPHVSLDSMHLYISQNCPPTDIETWVGIAVSRGVRDLLVLRCRPCFRPIRLPRSLYTCETLATLSLEQAIIVDVPLNICFPSLKSLSLIFVEFPSDETVHRLLSGCCVLEDLKVVRCGHDKVKTFKIMVPSLQRLTLEDLFLYGNPVPGHDVGFVIKAPCLKSLAITSRFGWLHSLVKMPYLVKANIFLKHGDSKNLLGCVTSAKHLSLCVKQVFYPIGDFNELVSLKVCTCSLMLYRLILRRAPKLRFLRFQGLANFLQTPYLNYLQKCYSSSGQVQSEWEAPSSVPECLISSLETVEWDDYEGTEAENKEVLYLVDNSGGQLQTVAVTLSNSDTTRGKRHMILVEPKRRSSNK